MSTIPHGRPEEWDSPQWRQIPLFPDYWISEHGRVFNMKTGKISRVWFDSKGYAAVSLSHNKFDGKLWTTRSIPRLIREIFPELE